VHALALLLEMRSNMQHHAGAVTWPSKQPAELTVVRYDCFVWLALLDSMSAQAPAASSLQSMLLLLHSCEWSAVNFTVRIWGGVKFTRCVTVVM
jgi:hypothetical protein